MRKIPTALVRSADRTHVTPVIAMGCEWVFAGEGVPTRKFDGTGIMFDGSSWWARREVKPGKTPPSGFLPAGHDDATGKTQGWEPIRQSPFYNQWREAHTSAIHQGHTTWPISTYELVGPKINGNPERYNAHFLIRHGSVILADVDHIGGDVDAEDPVPRDVLDVMAAVKNLTYEGVVWHHPDGRMAKLKRRDIP